MRRIAPGPFPFWSQVKMPGEAEPTVTVAGSLVTVPLSVFTSTSTDAGPVTSSTGNWALICKGEAKNKGAGVPFTKTRAPANRVGKGLRVASAGCRR